ncbi:MAG: hypothetical protein ABMA14_15220 [Hyphomonadaceae bacterium]
MTRDARAGTPHLIELRLHNVDQIFDPFDPFPIPTRDLAKGAEEFIVGWALDLPRKTPLALRIYLATESAGSTDVQGLGAAISSHFRYRAKRTRSDIRELLAVGRASLLIGLCALGACIVLRQILQDAVPRGALSGFFAEGLVIVGWVANWRPVELFLYDWWPLDRRRQLFLRLAAAPVEVRSMPGPEMSEIAPRHSDLLAPI